MAVAGGNSAGAVLRAVLEQGVATRTAIRSYALDLPLDAHPVALRPNADVSPPGIARQIIALLERLDLSDVTLVGNDTGGAICQFLIDIDHTRIGRLVLTNCDAFDKFPLHRSTSS